MSPGDAELARLRFDEAARAYRRAGDDAGLRRLFRLAVAFGRARLVAALQRELPAGDGLDAEDYRRFLRERALPQLPIGGDVERGFAVDEQLGREIAAELGEPPRELYARTARWMRARGSRHVAKLYVFARLGGDDELAAELQAEFDARAAHPRRELAARLPGRVLETLQPGDDDAYNPISAAIWRVELDGREVIMKEHLRLPIDYSRIDGYSEELETLAAAAGPHVVKLLGAIRLPPHEVLVLERVPGARPDAASARRVLRELAQVIERMHARGVVYLDMKAENVLFDETRGATLLDFGMARRLAGEATVATLPSTLEVVPPETRELRAGPPADVYQLGLLARALLGDDAPALVARMLDDDPARRPTAAEARVGLS